MKGRVDSNGQLFAMRGGAETRLYCHRIDNVPCSHKCVMWGEREHPQIDTAGLPRNEIRCCGGNFNVVDERFINE